MLGRGGINRGPGAHEWDVAPGLSGIRSPPQAQARAAQLSSAALTAPLAASVRQAAARQACSTRQRCAAGEGGEAEEQALRG